MNKKVRIEDLKNRISKLPTGTVAKKNIKGKTYYYHRFYKDGARVEKYIDFDDVDVFRKQIDERKKLEKELKLLASEINTDKNESHIEFETIIRTGKELNNFSAPVTSFKKRECFSTLHDYVYDNTSDRVFILYGLRRTGKTTMIRQVINEMSDDEKEKTAFIQITAKNTLAQVNRDMKKLEIAGYKYIFIDEVTLMEDFIEGAALFSDIYAASGIKVVLSGTDSLGFLLSQYEQLFDRCIMLHTTFIPYREFESVLGIKGIDEYIRFGGTMSLGGRNYNESFVFEDSAKTNAYIDSAIAKNIQHSLKYYRDGSHFRLLAELFEKGELTSAINRVVEDINHRFTKEILTKEFRSNDLRLSARNLRADKANPTSALDDIDNEEFHHRLKKLLDILDRDERTVQIEEVHAREIKEYLKLLDLIYEIDLRSFPNINDTKSIIVISQPGMRYSQATALIESLLRDKNFGDISIEERNRITERIRNEIRGRMMEEIILLETKLANPKKEIFKLQFAIGEFDMVVADPISETCRIYEIKYSNKTAKEQYRHLQDKEKCERTENFFGRITEKAVIYRGVSDTVDGIKYINAEEYLNHIADKQTI